MKISFSRLIVYLLPLASFAAAQPEQLGFNPRTSNGLERASSIYIAPSKGGAFYLMRDPNGEYREFLNVNFPSSKAQQNLLGGKGWCGVLYEKEGTIKIWSSTNVVSGTNLVRGVAEFVFKNGRLIQHSQNGNRYQIPYVKYRKPTLGGSPHPPPFSQAQAEKTITDMMNKKWKKAGRLRWPFKTNPNDNASLFLLLAMLSTVLFYLKPVFGHIRIPLHALSRLRVFSRLKNSKLVISDVHFVGGLCFLAASMGVVMAYSRGAFAGFLLGLTPMIVLNFRKIVRSKEVWFLVGVVFLMAVVWFATHDLSLLTRGFTKDSEWSNLSRVERFLAAPKMITEAPGTWDGMRINNAVSLGRAYFDWYDNVSHFPPLIFTLVSDHLMFLIGHGDLARFGYLFAWFCILSLLAYTAVRTKRADVLGVFIAAAVAGFFNDVLLIFIHFLWVIPLVAFIIFLAQRPWRVWKLRMVCLLVAGSAVLAAATLSGIHWAGNKMSPKRGYPISVVGGQVRVKSDNPDIWIVDDGYALGESLSCREIRRYYKSHPSAPPVGYVRSVEDLPRNRLKRLVLSGKSDVAWLDWLRKSAESGTDPAELIPEELVFISPTILPSELPPELLQACKVRYVIGEFVTRYHGGEFVLPPSWVTVVPKMEIYIRNWMRFAVEDIGGESKAVIHVENGQARVNGDDPDIWIVDDGKALGGVLSCSDIRWYYGCHPSAPAVGYVRRVEDLPKKAGTRLVLAGDAGQKWLDWMQKAADKGQDVRHLVPKELVFISPTFMPSEFPPGIDKVCKVKYVVGEFVTRYHQDEFEDPPEWVKVVPGMELYIQDWMRFAVE